MEEKILFPTSLKKILDQQWAEIRRGEPEIVEIENNLQRLFGTAVKLHYGLKKGRIEIEYYGDDDLDRILQLFAKID